MTTRHGHPLVRHAGLALSGSMEDLTNDQLDGLLRSAGIDPDALCRMAQDAVEARSAESAPAVEQREDDGRGTQVNLATLMEMARQQTELLKQLHSDMAKTQQAADERLRRMEQRLYAMEETVVRLKFLATFSEAAKPQSTTATGVEDVAVPRRSQRDPKSAGNYFM